MAFQYDRPPKGETRFDWKGQTYRRGYQRCKNCGHWTAKIRMDMKNFYAGKYVDATYGKSLKENFEKILALPQKKSDNQARVKRFLLFAKKQLGVKKQHSLLDIGSGLAVFPFEVKKAGWKVTALDPDPRATNHAKNTAGLTVINADFIKYKFKNRILFDAISFNKVLEHVKNPHKFLLYARKLIKKNGFIYIEVPDVLASQKGRMREEFFIEHLHIFSSKSMNHILKKSGFEMLKVKNIRDPSKKFTIFCFAKPYEKKT